MISEAAIVNILKEQIKSYRILHDLLKKERVSLIDIDAEKISEIAKEKDTVIMRLRLLEEERVRLIKQFVEAKDLAGDINLNELGELTGNGIFSELRSQLLSLLQSIEEMNKFNSILIDRSLNYIRSTSNFINTFTNEDIPQSTGVILSKET